MKKIIAIVMAALMLLGMTACSGNSAPKAAPAEIYTCQMDFVEAGYEGDCINQKSNTLVLNADGTYTMVENFTVNQVSGIVVFFTTTFYTGNYKVDSTADGEKTVSLEAATKAVANAAGQVTTSEEDAALLEGCPAKTVTCNTETNALTLE